ncbi:hypothetical protein [Streptomyces sp. SID8352]|uniref:hypothetical protein n=1 Tax=Streptomyces sp. SID8352 TaxID=2690338 RepID=UPI001369A2B6|nr:hypothetical protein [Streptomyces sp. SID8352]MYU22937.1 hypothetical protein [Streptomyces sp. SID8352]
MAEALAFGWPLPALIVVLAAASTLAAGLLAAAIDTSLRLAQALLRRALTGRRP